jgi:uncharacterized protein Yka (UPF0111/DUF47 family)
VEPSVPSRLRRLGRDLTGRSDHTLLEYLIGQLASTAEGAALARRAVGGEVDAEEARERISAIESEGDEHRRELVLELSATLAAPIDREDLFRLSRSVDDVLDNLRDLVREMHLYGIASEPLLDAPLAGVEDGVEHLTRAARCLVDQPGQASHEARLAKKNEIRRRYQQAMADLLQGDEPVTGLVLRRRELLRRVDVIGLRVGEAADALTDGAVKRSH